MELFHTILAIVALILSSAVVSSAEISLASSRKLKLQSLANEGDVRALQVLKLQEHPGRFITVVQILLNMVAILGGGIGESALSPYIADILNRSFEGNFEGFFLVVRHQNAGYAQVVMDVAQPGA